jgi:hypothetical protein
MPVDPANFGNRVDGTAKGMGFFGALKRPDGDISTELSVGVNIEGKELEIPLLVPGLTKAEIQHLLEDGEPTDEIVGKAVLFARQRMAKGLSPFAGDKERFPLPEDKQ